MGFNSGFKGLKQDPCAIGMVKSQWIKDLYTVNIPSWGKIYF